MSAQARDGDNCKCKVEHEDQLLIVLQVLQEHQLYTKFSKCDFYKPHIQYLCHIISERGIALDPKNIKSIDDCPNPTSVIDISFFLGLFGYYKKFIEKFSMISCLVTALQNKESKFLCTTKCKENFQKIKQFLMTTPIL